MFRQAKWSEPLIYRYDSKGKIGISLPEIEDEIKRRVGDLEKIIPKNMLRNELKLPQVSEPEVVRHFIRLSQMNFSIDTNIYPLGSCTMKYNPKISEKICGSDKISMIHPYQDIGDVQGILEILYMLGKWICEITGMDYISLQPVAGAHGELTGVLIIRAYHIDRKDFDRNEILIPDSAHGTNPASAAMGGFKIVRIPTNSNGNIDIEALKMAVSRRTAGIMLTNPNTLGLFEKDILNIAEIVHEAGGLLYYDGANLNGIMGWVRPGDMGFDIVHINFHKTFAAPHGGGGPGAGGIAVKSFLRDFLPKPIVNKRKNGKYYLDYSIPKSIGKVRIFYGNIIPLVKAFIYILMMGGIGLKKACEIAVLNTNYFISKIREIGGYSIPYGERYRKHEVVISTKPMLRKTGISAEDVAKALLNKGLHAPTIYFPTIVDEALMIEFTETESKREIDKYIDALKNIYMLALKDPDRIRSFPKNTSIGRLDLRMANHPKTITLTYRMALEKGFL